MMATEVTIYDVTGAERYSTPVNEGSKRKFLLMSDDHVTLKFSTVEPVAFTLGDYADIEGFGRFVITDRQKPAYNTGTGGYDYELQMEAQYRKWKNKLFKFIPQAGTSECSWVLTADARTHLEQVLKNIQALAAKSAGYLYNGETAWDFSIDADVDAKAALTVSYDGISILDAIAAIAEAFECEWWVDNNVIRLGRCGLEGDCIGLVNGVNVESMTREQTDELHATRIYPYGGTDNIPSSYRKELIFTVTNAYTENNCISDAARPLSHEWFVEEMVHSKPAYKDEAGLFGLSSDEGGVLQTFKTTGTHAVQFGNTNQSWPYSQPIEDLSIGEYTLILADYRPVFKRYSNLYNSGTNYQSPTAAVSSMFVRVTVQGNYKDVEGNTQVESHYVDVSAYLHSPDTEIAAGRGNADIQIAHPLTSCRITFTVYAAVSAAGQIRLSWTPYGNVWFRSKKKVYSITGIELGVLDSDKIETRTISGVVYNPDFASGDNEANRLQLPEGESLSTGRHFKIKNIITERVRLSYLSSVYGDGDNGIITNSAAERRLMLPEDRLPYIDAYEGMHEEEAVEARVTYDGIYPQREETISAVNPVEVTETETYEDGSTADKVRTYYDINIANFTAGTPFKKEYITESVDGEKKLTINFTSGVLDGRSFELEFTPDGYFEEDQVFRIVPYDESEITIPNGILKPSEGDTFVLTNFNVQLIAEHYVSDAQQKLLDTATADLKKAQEDAASYQCTMMSGYMAGYDGDTVIEGNAMLPVLTVGRKVRLYNPAYFSGAGRESRIIGVEYNLDIPYDSPVITVGNKAAYKRISGAEERIGKLEAAMGGGDNASSAGWAGVAAGGGSAGSGSAAYLIKTGSGTPASDTNTYSALRMIADFTRKKVTERIEALWKFVKGLTVGDYVKGESGASIDEQGNTEVGFIDVRAAARIGGDAEVGGAVRAGRSVETGGDVIAEGNVIAEGQAVSPGFRTPDFIAGALAGTGGAMYTLDGMAYGEVDYLTVRRGMTVAELVIHEYKSVGGALVVSPCNGEIESVYRWSNGDGYDIYIKDFEENPQFVPNDYARCARWDSEAGEYVGYWVRIAAVATDSNGKKCLNVSASDFPTGTEPKAGDKLVQMGNANDTARQGCIVITTERGTPQITVLAGISRPQILPENYRALYGCLDGFTDPGTGDALSGYGLWSANAYLTGSLRLRSSGKTVEDALIDALSNRRNYARGTGRAFRLTEAAGGTNETHVMYDVLGLKAGDTVTVSFDWKCSGILMTDADHTGRIWVQFNAGYGYAGIGFSLGDEIGSAENAGHHCATLTLGEYQWGTTEPVATTTNGKPYIGLDYVTMEDGGYFEVSNFMVTGGDKEAQWVEAPEDAFTDAAEARAEAEAAAARLDRWADDGVISPTEKRELRDERARIDSDYDEITQKHDNNYISESGKESIEGYYTAYEEAYLNYWTAIDVLVKDTPETIVIPEDFSGYIGTGTPVTFMEIQQDYYSCRAAVLQALTYGYQSTVDHELTVMDGLFRSVQSRTESLAAGGRNLLVQTNEGVTGWIAGNGVSGGIAVSESAPYKGNTGVTFTRNASSNGYEVFAFRLRPEMIEAGKVYTLGFDALLAEDSGALTLNAGLRKRDGTGALNDTVACPELLTPGVWKRVCFLLTASATGTADLPEADRQTVYLSVPASDLNIFTALTIVNLKLEEGEVPTAWTRAPEDTDILRTEMRTEIQQTADEINLTVSQEIGRVDGSVAALESEIRQTAENISLKIREDADSHPNHAYGTGTPARMETGFDAEKTNVVFRLYDVKGIKTGDTVTVSCDMDMGNLVLSDASRVTLQMSDVFGYKTIADIVKDGVLVNNGGSVTFTIGQNTAGEDVEATDTGYIYLRLDNVGAETGAYVEVSRLKLEKGAIATGWTPLTATLRDTLKETGIDIELDRITLKAPSTEVVAYDDNNTEYPVAMFTTEEITETDEEGNTVTRTVPMLNAALVRVDGLTAKRLIAIDGSEPAQVVSTINVVAQDGKYYTHYPVTYDSEGNADASTVLTEADGYRIGHKASSFGYNADDDYLLRVFTRSGKASWGLKVGDEYGNNAGLVTGWDKWKALGMCRISSSTDVAEDESGYTEPLIFPDSVSFEKVNGSWTAVPAYANDSGLALIVKYKQFMPTPQSEYLGQANFIKGLSGDEIPNPDALGEDYGFTGGITGKFVKTGLPVQGAVKAVNGDTGTKSVTYTWTVYVYEDGVLKDTVYSTRNFIDKQ